MAPNYTYIYLPQTLIFPLRNLVTCLGDISGWITNNKLRLNANKTDFIIIGTSRQCSKLTHFFPTNIHSHSITQSDIVRNLGVTCRRDFNFRKHFSLTCRSCFYHIRDLGALSVAKTIATTLITNRLHYCNFLLYNIASKDILKLQCVQNCLARVFTQSSRFSQSVPLLIYIHWLPVQSRIIFKLCTIGYHTLSSGEPSYLFPCYL